MSSQVVTLFEACDDCGDGPGWIIVKDEFSARSAICNDCWNERGKPEVLGYVD